jgi:nucleotide-binding universal stress UspA family protein
MYRKILVPLDGSHMAEEVLPQVRDLARLTGAEICLLRVVLVHALPGADPTERQVEAVREAEDYLEGIRQRLEKQGFKTSVHVRYGHDAMEILEQAQQEDIDLVTMSTHGRTGLGRWALGSVSERVLRHSPKPVLLVRVGKGGPP